MEALDMVATDVVAGPKKKTMLNLGAVAAAPLDEPVILLWPGWARMTILVGGGAALWAGIAWAALQVF